MKLLKIVKELVKLSPQEIGKIDIAIFMVQNILKNQSYKVI